jgi:SNF family Na+-dependent transporter
MAWSFSFFFDSFKSPLPWVLESASTNATDVSQLWNEDFFHNDTLKRSKDINYQGGMVGGLVGCLVLAYVVTYFSAWKGLASTGKMVYVTCIMPYVILTILLIKGATLEGASVGLEFLFKPDWEIVWKTETWKAAAIQILFSSGVAYGPFMYYGTARAKNDTIVAASFWIPLANSATSIYAALTVFMFIGHVSTVTGIDIDKVATSGPTLFFVAFPSLLGLLPGANFWSVIFFAMAVFLGIDSVFGFFDYYIKIVEDSFPELKKKMRKEFQVLVITIVSFICSLMFVTEGGYWNFDLFD